MFELLLFVAVVFLIKFIIDQGFKNEHFFKDKRVQFLKPNFFVGNFGNMFTRKRTVLEFFVDVYQSYPNEKVMGMFQFRKPVLIVRDPELVKQLTVKEFDHFVDHNNLVPKEIEPIFGKSLFALTGDEWREMRATLSPAFTGSKMRLMFELVSKCAKQMADFVNKETKAKGIQTYEMKDFFSRMSTDIIATCAFGIEVNSLKDQDNEFFIKGKDMLNFTKAIRIVKTIFLLATPKLLEVFKISIIPKSVTKFFKRTIIDTIQYRERNHIIRPDMINLLMEAKTGKLNHEATEQVDTEGFATVAESHVGRKEGKKNLDEEDITSQCFLFFFAGFETVSTALCFLGYEMAVNPEVQDRLYQEVSETNEDLDQKSLNYDSIQKMRYMDMVVSELLRKWPPQPFLDRLCTKELVIDDAQNLKYNFEKGDIFNIPTIGFQHDPQYFPNPQKFDPERFNDDNKHKIIPGTYLPFGIGPRNCIGSRFALMEIKAILYYILLNFKIEPNEKTQIPVKLSKDFAMKTEKGVWVQFTPRNKT